MSYQNKVKKISTESLYLKRKYLLNKIDICQDYINTMQGKSYLGILGAEVEIERCDRKVMIIGEELRKRESYED